MEELEVTTFEWPDRFFVSCRNKDDEYRKFFKGLEDFDPYAPYLVDLSELVSGWCACREFAVYIWPNLETPNQKTTECVHIQAARRYQLSQQQDSTRRRQLPSLRLP